MPRPCVTSSRSSSHERAGWWSSVELPGSYVAPRIDRPINTLEALCPPDLTGKTVLHVGGRDGYFAFAAERLGASRVVALDAPSWRCPGGKDGFEYAKNALASEVEGIEMEISDISPETVGEFDVVMFLDVLHRLRHPLPALERIARVTGERLIVETLADVTFLRLPAAALYPWNTRDGQPRWAPNRAAVLAMLRGLGFDRALAIPIKHVTWERLKGLPEQIRTGIDVLGMTPRTARPGLRRDLAKSLTTQSRLIAHGWRAGCS